MNADLSWKQDGNCVGVDPDLMFPGQGESVAPARRVCAGCPVTNQCLQYALDNCEKFGLWGGKTERERRLLRTRRTKGFRLDRTPKPWCLGTRWSYNTGCRCDTCTAAEQGHHPERTVQPTPPSEAA